MKNRIVLLLVLVSMLMCFAMSCDPIPVDVFGSISGTVIESDSGDPVPQATVTLSPSGKNTYTGNDGQFEFHDLEARQYTVTVQKTGYQTNRKSVTTVAGDNVDISLTLKKNN